MGQKSDLQHEVGEGMVIGMVIGMVVQSRKCVEQRKALADSRLTHKIWGGKSSAPSLPSFLCLIRRLHSSSSLPSPLSPLASTSPSQDAE